MVLLYMHLLSLYSLNCHQITSHLCVFVCLSLPPPLVWYTIDPGFGSYTATDHITSKFVRLIFHYGAQPRGSHPSGSLNSSQLTSVNLISSETPLIWFAYVGQLGVTWEENIVGILEEQADVNKAHYVVYSVWIIDCLLCSCIVLPFRNSSTVIESRM